MPKMTMQVRSQGTYSAVRLSAVRFEGGEVCPAINYEVLVFFGASTCMSRAWTPLLHRSCYVFCFLCPVREREGSWRAGKMGAGCHVGACDVKAPRPAHPSPRCMHNSTRHPTKLLVRRPPEQSVWLETAHTCISFPLLAHSSSFVV